MGLFGSKPEQATSPHTKKAVRVKKAENNFRFDGEMPRKSKRVGRYRRSLSWDGSMDYRRKFWDAGGLTLKRSLPEPINIKQYIADAAYSATELLPEVIVKKLPEIPEKKKNPYNRKPKTFGEELALVSLPSNIPSVLHVKQLLETSIVAQKQITFLKQREMICRNDYEHYRMYAWRAEQPNNKPSEETGNLNQYNYRERDEYNQQCEWYNASAEKSLEQMKKAYDKRFNLETVLPLLKNAVENCFKVVINQADLNDEAKNLILNNLWDISLSDCLHTYAKLKIMIFRVKLDWERQMKISRTKEALIANYRNEDVKIRVQTDVDCVEAKCCKGTCKLEGKLCHRERYLNFKDGEIIMKVLYGKCTIILPKKTLLQHAEVNPDPYKMLSLRDPEKMVLQEFPFDELPQTSKPYLDSILHGLRVMMVLLRHETLELLRSFYMARDSIRKIEGVTKSLKNDRPTKIVPLPLFSSFHFESIKSTLRELADQFEDIPKSIELCPDVNENDYPDQYRDEEAIEKIMAEIKTPASYTSHPFPLYRDLRATNFHTWTYFKQE